MPNTDSLPPIKRLEHTLIKRLLSPRALSQYELGDIAHQELKPFVPAIKALSERYLAGGEAPPISEFSARAYALYYTPINFFKLLHLIGLIPAPQGGRLRILDVGCGPGTASIAALSALTQELSITAVDRSPAMRALAQDLIAGFANASVGTLSASLHSLRVVEHMSDNTAPFDVIVAANVINELTESERDSAASELATLLAPDGVLLLLEPALPATTRRLMRLRDFLLVHHQSLSPIFPCTHRNQCPMLVSSETDWCHGSLEGAGKDFDSSKLVDQFDDLLGYNKHRVKYSALILQASGSTPSGYRVMRDAEVTRRGIEVLLCGQDFYGSAVLSKKLVRDSNRALRKARQFDRILSDPSATAELTDTTTITLEEP